MDSIKDNSYLNDIKRIMILISFFSLIFIYWTKKVSYLPISFLSFLIFLLIDLYEKERLKKQLKILIYNCDAIIDSKDIIHIDGEGELSILSNKLFLLKKRYYSLMSKMKDEQTELKEYIEDISHQLKTPITSMRLNEELLLETIDNQKQKEKINEIYIQTLKMNQLVNDLLTLALIDSHSITFQYKEYSFEYILNNIEEDLDYLLSEHNMKIHLNKDLFLICDKKWLGEALKNIIKNCIEKNKNSYIDVDVSDNDSIIKIIIKDYGQGFSENDLDHVFERFYRGENHDEKGVGIGLALSKEIIKGHYGSIEARNDQGALFEIILPKSFGKKKL